MAVLVKRNIRNDQMKYRFLAFVWFNGGYGKGVEINFFLFSLVERKEK